MSKFQGDAQWFWYLPSVVLIGVACTQLWLAHAASLTPWSGGGFGMFSTADTRGNRHLHAFAIRPGIRRELAIPASFKDRIRHLLACPTDAALRALAADLADLPSPDAGPLVAIEIQVWVTRFAPAHLTPSGSLLRSLEVPLGTN
jgi:hypothetical protein